MSGAQLLLRLNSQVHQGHGELQSGIVKTPNSPTTPPSKPQGQPPVIAETPKKLMGGMMEQFDKVEESESSLTEMLLSQIGTVVSESISEVVESALRVREKRAYVSFTQEDTDYLQVLLEHTREKDEETMGVVGDILSARASKVEHQLQVGQCLIHHERNITSRLQLEALNKFDLARMIRIKEGELRSKVDILREKMDDYSQIESIQSSKDGTLSRKINSTVSEHLEPINYSLQSEKTRIAKDYVRHMQEQKKLLERRKAERESIKMKEAEERQAEIKEAEGMRDIAKKQQILQKIEMRRRQREEQEKELAACEEKVRFSQKQYRPSVPLFRKREKEFKEKVLKPEEQYREEKLTEIRQYRQSMSLEQINAHQQKYLKKIEVDKAKREEEMKLIMKTREAEYAEKGYYRSRNFSSAQEQANQELQRHKSEVTAHRMKHSRMQEYAKAVSKGHKPAIDPQKRSTLLSAIEQEEMKKKGMRKVVRQIQGESSKTEIVYEALPQHDAQKEGNKYLLYSRQHIKREPVKPSTSMEVSSIETPPMNVSLLKPIESEDGRKGKSIWDIRIKQINRLPNADECDPEAFEMVKRNFELMDSKAAQTQQTLKQMSLGIGEEIDEKGKLDCYYLESVKKKMALLE